MLTSVIGTTNGNEKKPHDAPASKSKYQQVVKLPSQIVEEKTKTPIEVVRRFEEKKRVGKGSLEAPQNPTQQKPQRRR